MLECEQAIQTCMRILKVAVLASSLPGSLSSTDSVFARVGGIADSSYARVRGNSYSVSAPPGVVPMSRFEVPPASLVQQHSSSGMLRDGIRYCLDFEPQELYIPTKALRGKEGNLPRHDSL